AAAHRAAGARGELCDRLGGVEPVGLHQPAEGVALLAAAEADERAALGVDVEGWRRLGVRRAQAAPGLARALELDLGADQLDHVDARADLGDVAALGHPVPLAPCSGARSRAG